MKGRLTVYISEMEGGGFTLFEVLIVLILTGILSTAFAVNFRAILTESHETTSLRWLESDIKMIRGAAAEKGGRGVLVVASDLKSYSYGVDLSPYSSSTSPAFDSQIARRNLPQGITLSLGTSLVFDARGFLINPATEALQSVIFSLASNGVTYRTGNISSAGELS